MSKTIPKPKPEPLFVLDLGDNGGQLAPTDIQQLEQWIQTERAFWNWLYQSSRGNHEQVPKQRLSQLDQALNSTSQARQHEASNPQHANSLVEATKVLIQNVFVLGKFPHSSTPQAKKVDSYRQDAGEVAASFMMGVMFPSDQGFPIQPSDVNSWRGVVESLIDRFDLLPAVHARRKAAAESSFEQLRAETERMLGEKTTAYDALHRDYSLLTENAKTINETQISDFASAQTERGETFAKALTEHTESMSAIRKAFREEMGLRAPAEYWESKRSRHVVLTWITGSLSFIGIAVAAALLFNSIHDLIAKTLPGQAPETWRLGALALIALFAIWEIRLVVRMFLSNMHLMTDAAERVVMLKTYLALAEAGQLAEKDDRHLILQALFRPTADGFVKDDGVPASVLEMATRSPKP